MAHPRGLDEDLIDAYRARRALDYLVGFTLSPVLWRKLPGRQIGGPGPVGGAAADRRSRARDRDVPRPGILERHRDAGGGRDRIRRAPGPLQWRQDRPADDRRRRHRPGREEGGRGGPVQRRLGRDQAAQSATRRRPSPPRPCSRRRRASSASRRARRCGSRRASTRTDRSPICAPTACRWRPRRSPPRARAVADRYDAGYVPDKPRHLRDQGQERAGSA